MSTAMRDVTVLGSGGNLGGDITAELAARGHLVTAVTRRGDGVVSWACPQHLAAVCDGMQRDDEVTELVVVLVAKLLEWLRLGARLEGIAL